MQLLHWFDHRVLQIRLRPNVGIVMSIIESNILTKEIIAANNNIFTRRSSNCSRINSQSFLPSSAGISRNYSCLAVILHLYSDTYHYIHKY